MYIDYNKKNEKSNSPWIWVIVACIIVKTFMFYSLMGIRTNLLFLLVATAMILILLFAGLKNRRISYGIYVAVTILMFCDVTFNGYFNGYLSFNSMGSAKYLPEVWDVIKTVIRPGFWLLFADLPIVALSLSMIKGFHLKKPWAGKVLLTWILGFMVMGSVSLSPFMQSVGNLEFFSAHIVDILETHTAFARPRIEILGEEDYSLDQADIDDDPLFGIGKDRNLIVIQMEALQNFVINMEYQGEEITPELNRLIRDKGSLYFDHYYMQIASGNTSDAEFATNNSLYGSAKSYTYEIYKENTFRGLPVLLKELGYSTIAMHGYDGKFWSRKEMYPAQGFDTFIDAKGYKPTVKHGWGILDEEFYKQSVDYLLDLPQPFYSFMVSLSNHTPFEIDKKYQRLEMSHRHKDTRFGNYLNSTAYSDYALGVLLDELKGAGLYDNSIIVIYGDHFGLAIKDDDNEAIMTELLGKPYRFDDMANVPLIIHIPGEEINQRIETAGGQIDFLPTIAYIMGMEELDTLYLGQNLIKAKEGFVAQNRYAAEGSFITNEIIFFMSGDRVFENGNAWRTDTGEAVPFTDLKRLYEKSLYVINSSERYLEDDAIGRIYNQSVEEKSPGESGNHNEE